MKAITFTLRNKPDQRLNLACLTPERLAGLSEADIAALPINTTREARTVGDMFKVGNGDVGDIHISASDGARLDNIGQGMTGGRISVEGGAGAYAGQGMSGGELRITGNTGPFAGSGMSSGFIRIKGDTGDHLGAARTGEMRGMNGGTIVVTGRAGARAGDRVRRGLIAIGGDAGDYAGSRMIAGTVAIFGNCGVMPGYLMRRGTVILTGDAAAWTPTFIDSGRVELTYLRLLAVSLKQELPAVQLSVLKQPARRLSGDLATIGKGEILHLKG
jgi:formylmethanofuran dehydrogenase subunit C